MPISTVEIDDEQRSQGFFQAVVKTVPVLTNFHFANLRLMLDEQRGEVFLGRGEFLRARRSCLPLLFKNGCQIEGGELKLITWMKSSVYLTHLDENRSTVWLRVAGDTIRNKRADPKGGIDKWFKQLAKRFNLEVKS